MKAGTSHPQRYVAHIHDTKRVLLAFPTPIAAPYHASLTALIRLIHIVVSQNPLKRDVLTEERTFRYKSRWRL
jgi:hypothetical protein